MKALVFFHLAAVLEIVGSYYAIKFMYDKSIINLIIAGILLTLFGLSLSVHHDDPGRIFAIYGGIYISSSIAWLKFFDGADLTKYDVTGALIAIIGALVILMQPK